MEYNKTTVSVEPITNNSIFSQVDEVYKKLEVLVIGNFYGSLEIKFENGKIVNCKKTESIKL